MTDLNTPARDDDARASESSEQPTTEHGEHTDESEGGAPAEHVEPTPLSPPAQADRADGPAPVDDASSRNDDAPARNLYDDGALRAAEAASSGEPETATSVLPASASASAPESGVEDTRIVAPRPFGTPAPWTPPPAPASPVQNREAQDARASAPATAATTASPSAASSLGFDDSGIAEEGTGAPLTHSDVLVMQKEEFGGIRFGAAFFGWLTATGVLSILFGISGLALGIYAYGRMKTSSGVLSVTKLPSNLTGDVAHVVTVVVTLVFLVLAYYAGGYVASRMARFSGARQGLAVWLWGVVVTVVIGVVLFVVAVQHSSSTSLTNGGSFFTQRADPILDIVWGGLAILLTLAAAILGGLQGLRFHRRVDRLGDGY